MKEININALCSLGENCNIENRICCLVDLDLRHLDINMQISLYNYPFIQIFDFTKSKSYTFFIIICNSSLRVLFGGRRRD